MAVQRLEIPLAAVAELCRSLGVVELSIFGSALRDDFGAESDIDFLVSFEGGDLGPWMSKLNRLEEGLSAIFGRRADVTPKDSLKWVIRERVLDSAEIVYVASD